MNILYNWENKNNYIIRGTHLLLCHYQIWTRSHIVIFAHFRHSPSLLLVAFIVDISCGIIVITWSFWFQLPHKSPGPLPLNSIVDRLCSYYWSCSSADEVPCQETLASNIKTHDSGSCGQVQPVRAHNRQVCIIQEPNKCLFTHL